MARPFSSAVSLGRLWRLAALLVFLLVPFLVGCDSPRAGYTPRTGDIIFQSLPRMAVVDMIEGATGSAYSHCGVVQIDDAGKVWVIEALGDVHATPLDAYLKRGRTGFDVYRLRPGVGCTGAELAAGAAAFNGLPYDFRYRMDDEAIYCSELVYKSYMNQTGKPLGTLVTVGTLDWKPYETTIRRLESGGPVPLDREMITPRDLAAAPELELVYTRRW